MGKTFIASNQKEALEKLNVVLAAAASLRVF
jgi:hypothetical protein